MPGFTIVMPYYENPGMLAEQIRRWRDWPEDVADQVKAIIVDDGSPKNQAANVVGKRAGLSSVQVYRVAEDRPWHQHAARNLGALMAGRNAWMLMTDMDHVVPPETARAVVEGVYDWRQAYRFSRRNVDGTPYKLHPNSWLIHTRLFWMAGGYDEDFCGIYGTDGFFRDCLQRLQADMVADGEDIQPEAVTLPEELIRYGREDLPDASTRGLPRKDQPERGERRRELKRRKAKRGLWRPQHTAIFEWERAKC